MDIDRLLNLERRTGIKNSEIDDFERKVDDVNNAIKGLLDGSVAPEDIKIEGLETEEEKLQKQHERETRMKIQREKEEKLRLQRKQEEKDRWWAGVEVYKPNVKNRISSSTSNNNSSDHIDGSVDNGESNSRNANNKGSNMDVVNRYTADYSRWNDWIPTDDASKAEIEELKAREDEIKNKEFEKNNAEFCEQFLTDMKERKKITEKKQESANMLRLKGNNYFKLKKYDKAIEFYYDAMKESPFDAKLVNNIAQTYIKTNQLDDALEFLARTLYLEPDNVKALSRKAFALGELGHSTEAVIAIQQALLLDPMNTDLIAQAKELNIIQKEKTEEKNIMMMMKDSKKLVDKDDVKRVKVDSVDDKNQLIIKDRSSNECITGSDNRNIAEELNKYLISLDNNTTTTSTTTNNNDNDNNNNYNVEGDDHSIYAQLLKMKMNIISEIKKDVGIQTTFRLSGCIQQLIKTIHGYTDMYKQNATEAAGGDVDDDGSSNMKMILLSCYDILAIIIDQQRASKLLIIELKLILSIKSLTKFIHIERDVSLLKSLIHLCHVLCYDDICVKSMNIIIGDKMILCYLSTCIGNISYNLNTLLSNTATTTSTTTSIKSDDHYSSNINFKNKIECLEMSIKIFKIALFSTISQNIFITLESSVCCTIVYSITTMFECALSYYNSALNKGDNIAIYESMLECLVEVSVGLSQFENFREYFSHDVDYRNGNHSNSNKSNRSSSSSSSSSSYSRNQTSLCACILQTIKSISYLTSNSIAALLNACIENKTTNTTNSQLNHVRTKIIDLDGYNIITSDLFINDLKREVVVDKNIFVRKTSLLAKLVGDDKIKQKLIQPTVYRYLCKRIACTTTTTTTTTTTLSDNNNHDQYESWFIEEKSNYIRILANLTEQYLTKSCYDIAKEENLINGLLSILPKPKDECGEITANSVILMPTSLASPLLLGNTARCLLPLADKEPFNHDIYVNKANYGIEKLICTMASCPDMRVRKNIAILLAKGCRLPGVREKVTALRGMQMMVELQDKL